MMFSRRGRASLASLQRRLLGRRRFLACCESLFLSVLAGARQPRRARRFVVSGRIKRTSFHQEILIVLAQAPERTALPSRQLAKEVGESVQSVAARLQPLVRAGLVAKHWGAAHEPGRAYLITQEGRDYLARVCAGTPRADGDTRSCFAGAARRLRPPASMGPPTDC